MRTRGNGGESVRLGHARLGAQGYQHEKCQRKRSHGTDHEGGPAARVVIEMDYGDRFFRRSPWMPERLCSFSKDSLRDVRLIIDGRKETVP